MVGEMEIGDASRLCFVFRDKVNRRGCGWRKCNGSLPLFCISMKIQFQFAKFERGIEVGSSFSRC